MEHFWIYFDGEGSGFDAKFKENVEDFIVNEISMAGKVLTLNDNKGLPAVPEFAKKYANWKKNPCEDAEKPEQQQEQVLTGLLDKIPKSDLENLAVGGSLEVGTIKDRDTRIAFNRELKNEHPHLAMHSVASVVSVIRCPAYPLFCKLFGEDGAAGIIQYAVNPSRAPLSLPYITDDKDLKKQFYETITAKFGAIQVAARDGAVTVTKKPPKRKRADIEQPYLHFTLQKTDLSWFESARLIARLVHCGEQDISCCGMKDKKAITVQRCSLKGLLGNKLARITHDKLRVCDMKYENEGLVKGQLLGNKFEITLRDVSVGAAAVCEAAKLMDQGFHNFFGSQRFAVICKQDLHAGLHLVRKEWERAVDVMMTCCEADTDEVNGIKTNYAKTGDALAAAKALPIFKNTEKDVLYAKSKHPAEPVKWFRNMPHSVRELWFHSFQSWLWNKVLYLRLKRHGSKVLKGDLILPSLTTTNKAQKAAPVVCEDPSQHVITEVVHPKPGSSSTLYPDNEVGAIYDEVLQEYGLTRADWDTKELNIKLTPSYRHINAKPEGVAVAEEGDTIKISFALPSSCYATVCLGEVMKRVL